jgi:formamidopyrimidine-DNA glycosylase
MPELPEVETIKREIAPFVKGKIISSLEIIDHRNIKGLSPKELRKKLAGKKIAGIDRRAKYLVFPLSPAGFLVVHLGMTGRLLFAPDKYVKVVFNFKNGAKLYFSDARLFGKIRYFDEAPKLDLGPEPLTKDFTINKFKELLQKRKTSIKLFLLNQKLISGVGNIYANEALFRAGVHPQRKASDLSDAEIKKLHAAINAILSSAIKHRGTSDNWYVDARGRQGSFQRRLKVYGRKGQPCLKCKTPIIRVSQGARGTFFCPDCQK